jgi:hypothetical protein
MTNNQGEHLSGLISAANAIADEALAGFGDVLTSSFSVVLAPAERER